MDRQLGDAHEGRDAERSSLVGFSIARGDLHALEDPTAQEQVRRERRHRRETSTIPRLRLLGYVGLLSCILLHNWLLLDSLHLDLVAGFACLQATHFGVSTYLLRRYYRVDGQFDLSTFFLATDVAVFVLSLYVSGGERSWLLAVLCVRVADQVGTSQRRAFAFTALTSALHAVLVLYMFFIEQRPFALSAEMTKVALMLVLNCYLSMAAAPGERQRRRANRTAAVARMLIEELRRKTEQLEVERVRAEAASQAKSAFLSNMSHEIRTPMTAVLGMAELLLSEPLKEREREMAETILNSGRSLLALVNDVLDMSKVEAGEIELTVDDMDLQQVLHGALSPMKVLASNKSLRLEFEPGELPNRQLVGDALRLKQVLVNLIGNAIKFTKEGGITVRVQVVDQGEDSCRVRFEVVDTGIGMTPEQLARAFEPFQQADVSTTRVFGGTGLGLSISKKLVALMGGNLQARSQLGEGSTFEFEMSFPYGAEVAPTRPSDAVRAVELLRLRRPRVLVAEDTEVNRHLLTRMLEHLGCVVDGVDNGAAAVARLSPGHRYDAVFMDWHMPVMDGLEAVKRIRRSESSGHTQAIPIIGVTASAFADEVARCREAGMDEVLSKPLVWSDLERALCRHALKTAQDTRFSERPSNRSTAADHLDRGLIDELCALDPDPQTFLRALFDEFLVAARENLGQLEDAVAAEDVERVRATAHALKGSASSVGAAKLAQCFAEIERLARESDLAALPTAIEHSGRELELTAQAFDRLLAQLPGNRAQSGGG